MTNPIDHDDKPIAADLRVDDNSAVAGGLHVTLDANDVLSFTDDSNTLYVFGGPGDSVDAGGGWTSAGQETVDGEVFNVYVQGEVVLKVDSDVDQSLIGLT